MTLDLALTPRAKRAQQLADAVVAREDNSSLDALLDAAHARFGGGAAHLSLLSDRQVTGGARGPLMGQARRGDENPFDDTICANALRHGAALVIPDTRADPRVSSIPAVADGAVRSYLGVPLRWDGQVLGVLCVFDDHPRSWTEADQAALEQIARDVVTDLDDQTA